MTNEITDNGIKHALDNMFPNGDSHITRHHVEHWLKTIAHRSFQEGKRQALLGLMTANDVADHYNISERRARALIANRHKRFGIGMQVGKSWLIHRDELPDLEPDKKHRKK